MFRWCIYTPKQLVATAVCTPLFVLLMRRFASACRTLRAQSRFLLRKNALVGLSGLEPPTSRLSGVRSNRLSYRPIGSFFRWVFSLFSHIFFSISCCKCTISSYAQTSLVHSKINSTQFLDRPLGILTLLFYPLRLLTSFSLCR